MYTLVFAYSKSVKSFDFKSHNNSYLWDIWKTLIGKEHNGVSRLFTIQFHNLGCKVYSLFACYVWILYLLLINSLRESVELTGEGQERINIYCVCKYEILNPCHS
jgi:hypothetical protein